MSGVAIMRDLLANYAPLLALVPASRIFSGQIPQGTAAPAIGVKTIFSNEIPTTARNLAVKTTQERVQVTVIATDPGGYAQQKRLLKACALGPGMHANLVVKGYSVRAVVPMGENPDLPPGEDLLYEQSRDFMVTFSEPH